MLNCFSSSFEQSPSHPPGNHLSTYQGNTPRQNAISSPTLNLSIEFSKALGTPSYTEVWNKIHFVEKWEDADWNQLLAGIIKPDKKLVEEVLQQTSSNHYINHLSTYFNHTEKICHLLIDLEHGIYHTCSLYTPIEKLISDLPTDPDSLNRTQCNWAHGTFLQFVDMENPFSCLGSKNFNDMHRCYSDLKDTVDLRLHKSRSGSSTFIRKAIRFAKAVASVSAHALSALVSGSSFPSVPKLTKEDFAFIATLDAAAMNSFAVHHRLQTINKLACQLQDTIESDKSFVRFGIDRGKESYPTSTVVKRLANGYPKICSLLADLEVHICLCFTAINSARSFLLQEIQVLQSL